MKKKLNKMMRNGVLIRDGIGFFWNNLSFNHFMEGVQSSNSKKLKNQAGNPNSAENLNEAGVRAEGAHCSRTFLMDSNQLSMDNHS